MKFRLETSRWRDGAQDLVFSHGGNTSAAVALTWDEVLELRNFLDGKLGKRERERRAAQGRTSMDASNVSLHILED